MLSVAGIIATLGKLVGLMPTFISWGMDIAPLAEFVFSQVQRVKSGGRPTDDEIRQLDVIGQQADDALQAAAADNARRAAAGEGQEPAAAAEPTAEPAAAQSETSI